PAASTSAPAFAPSGWPTTRPASSAGGSAAHRPQPPRIVPPARARTSRRSGARLMIVSTRHGETSGGPAGRGGGAPPQPARTPLPPQPTPTYREPGRQNHPSSGSFGQTPAHHWAPDQPLNGPLGGSPVAIRVAASLSADPPSGQRGPEFVRRLRAAGVGIAGR